jgi:Ribonucleotide reductase, small chain/SCP-2 sterol transfer family
VTSAAAQLSYEDLYARWEQGNWRATEIDFSRDREQWNEKLDDIQRASALWQYAMFFYGEDSVTDNLSPYIDAAPREEQKYFLATQQVDEARHAVFFSRFWREVIEQGDTIGTSLAATLPQLNWGYRQVFGRLDRMADELRRDRSLPKLAQAITLYHFVVEASLAQPGQHYIEDGLERIDALPGFRDGMRKVSLDEQRHIGFGVRMLHDLAEQDPECRDAVAELLREIVPYAAGVFVPPGWDERYATCWGFTLEEIYAFGMESIDSKLRAAGLPPEELPGGVPWDTDLDAAERARRALVLLKAGVLGERNGPPSRDPEVMGLLFDAVRHSVDPRQAPPQPLTLQWDFADAQPWSLRIDNGASEVREGRAEAPDLIFRCRYEDWVDVVAGRADPRRSMLTGRLRVRGRPRTLWRARNLFA